MTNDHRIAAGLRQHFGGEAGLRPTGAEVAWTIQQSSAFANRSETIAAAFNLTWAYEASRLVDGGRDPHGGAGWRLSAKGADLIARSRSTDSPGRAL